MRNAYRTSALVLGLVAVPLARGQDTTTYTFGDSTLLKEFKLDFQVPDDPAFKALGIDPSDILRPNDIKEVALMLAPYVGTSGVALPQNFAVEVSPGRLAARNWSVSDYSSSALRRLWANSAFSIGSRFDESEASDPQRISVGFRVNLLSKAADPLRNEWLYQVALQQLVGESALADAYVAEHGDRIAADLPLQKKDRIMNPDATDEVMVAERAAFLAWVNDYEDVRLAEAKAAMAKDFPFRLKKFEEESWNATRFDLAAAWSGQAADSTLRGVSYRAWHVWATAALRPCQSKHAQILIGANLVTSVDGDSIMPVSEATANVRYYYGGNSARGFLEGQYKMLTYERDQEPTMSALLINLGVEAKITDRLGVFASIGVENIYEPGTDVFSELRSSLDLRYFFR